MFDLVVKGSIRAFEREVRAMNRAIVKGNIRAMNRAAEQVRNEVVREVRETSNIKAGSAKRNIRSTKAKGQRNPKVVLSSRYNPIPLIDYGGTRKTKKGVSAQPDKTKPRKTFPGAFKARMPSGHTGWFQRRTPRPGPGQRWRDIRLPINELFGPPIIDLVEDRLEKKDQRIVDIYQSRVDHEVNQALRQVKSR